MTWNPAEKSKLFSFDHAILKQTAKPTHQGSTSNVMSSRPLEKEDASCRSRETEGFISPAVIASRAQCRDSVGCCIACSMRNS